MVLSDQAGDCRSRCQQQLMRLRVLAQSREGAELSGETSAEIRVATNAVIAEMETLSRTALDAGREREPHVETFLWVRIVRLAAEADRAVDAARTRDIRGLRGHLQQFDMLTSVIVPAQTAHSQ